MDAEKIVGMSFRVTPRIKRLLAVAAHHEHRSLTNMLEVLVEDFCARNGIGETVEDSSEKGEPRSRRSKM
jgi:hypothetical protein